VRDSSGAVLPGVDVTATQTDTNFARSTVTDAGGNYVLSNLPTGPYRLQATLAGFRTFQRTGIVLQVNANPEIIIEMAIGELAETVSVEAATPLVETRSPAVGGVIENERIEELPLNGRNPTELIALAGAAVPQPALNASSRAMQGGTATAVAGGSAVGVAYLLDGATHNNPYDNLNLPFPFPDALQEFRVETSTTTANNGMHSSASVNVVTKSGTNLLHGDLFEFVRNHRFEPQPVRRHAWWPDCDRQTVLLRRISGNADSRNTCRPFQVRSDGRDAGWRLHDVRVRGMQCKRRDPAACALCQQSHQPCPVQSRCAQGCGSAAHA
jgi:hypothetical protein